MREMGIQAIYPRQDTSRPSPGNPVYPYLLKGLDIDHPNHVWSIDITYIPVKTGWLYLVAIMDWYSRYVLDWRISDSMEIGFVLEASRAALRKAAPEIMNSDQGSHFTSPQYTGIFLEAGARISMNHRGRAYDNIFIERLWSNLVICQTDFRNDSDMFFKKMGNFNKLMLGIEHKFDKNYRFDVPSGIPEYSWFLAGNP